MPKDNKLIEDLQAASLLTIDGINGIVNIVEAMSNTVSRFGGAFGNTKQKRTSGITGFVYKIIRKIVGLVGFSLDALLSKLNINLQKEEISPGREAVLSALNGVLGDYLEDRNNVLAINMQLRINGKPINIEDQFSAQTLEQANGKLLLMIHGSSMNDLQWNRQEHNHAMALADEFGYLPVYLHYNTGLHISENGKQLAGLLEDFIKKNATGYKTYNYCPQHGWSCWT